MKVLELFAGTRSIGKAFEARGHEVFSVEWDLRFPGIDLYEDVLKNQKIKFSNDDIQCINKLLNSENKCLYCFKETITNTLPIKENNPLLG